MKKMVIILSAVFIVFLALGLWINYQYGARGPKNEFWRENGEGAYSLLNGDSIRYTVNAGETDYDLSLDGERVTAVARKTDGGNEVKFSDGWTVITHDNDYEFEIVLDDMDKMGLSFSKVTDTVREEVHGGYGEAVKEAVYLVTESGYDIYAGTYDRSRDDASIYRDAITLKNGSVIKIYGNNAYSGTTLYRNENSQYLLNRRKLLYLNSDENSVTRADFARFLTRLTQMKSERRGRPYGVVIYVVAYIVGALTLLFPNKMAFFGRRWMYTEESALSENGLARTVISGFMLMALGIIIMLAPAIHGRFR